MRIVQIDDDGQIHGILEGNPSLVAGVDPPALPPGATRQLPVLQGEWDKTVDTDGYQHLDRFYVEGVERDGLRVARVTPKEQIAMTASTDVIDADGVDASVITLSDGDVDLLINDVLEEDWDDGDHAISFATEKPGMYVFSVRHTRKWAPVVKVLARHVIPAPS